MKMIKRQIFLMKNSKKYVYAQSSILYSELAPAEPWCNML